VRNNLEQTPFPCPLCGLESVYLVEYADDYHGCCLELETLDTITCGSCHETFDSLNDYRDRLTIAVRTSGYTQTKPSEGKKDA